jgi:hypothetical protein
MFSIKSNKGIAIIAGTVGAIILVVLTSFSVFSYPSSSVIEKEATVGGNQTSQLFYIDRCYERPALSFVDTQGFETVKSMTNGSIPIIQGVPASEELRNGLYEFVLKPGSTGYIFTTYDFCPDWTKTGDQTPIYHNSSKEVTELLNPMNNDIFKFKDKVPENATSSDPLGSIATPSDDPIARFGTTIRSENLTGAKISPSNITRIDDQSVRITYVIMANNDAENGTYGISIAGSCIGEILTIGNAPNENSMAVEMVKGPFYGC